MNSSWDLEWDAPAECPGRDAVRSEVARLTETPKDGSRHFKARGSIQRFAGFGGGGVPPSHETAWILLLTTELDGVSGERTLSGSSCESLTDAAALTLALILNPDVAFTPPQPPAGERLLPPPMAVAAPNPRRPHPQWQVAAQVGIQTGVLGRLSSSFSISMGVALSSLSIHVIPSLTPPEDILVSAEAKTGGRLWAGSVAGLGCWVASVGRYVTLSPCAGLGLTMIQGKGLGVLYPREAAVYWPDAELAGLCGVRMSRRILLELGAIGLVPFSRPSLYLDGIGQVNRPAPFGVRAYGGLAWSF